MEAAGKEDSSYPARCDNCYNNCMTFMEVTNCFLIGFEAGSNRGKSQSGTVKNSWLGVHRPYRRTHH